VRRSTTAAQQPKEILPNLYNSGWDKELNELVEEGLAFW
jgi:hypothetical protein